ncbi:MAG: hypothetical protein ACR2IA_11790 [Pyrinomonadaceae bacterium]
MHTLNFDEKVEYPDDKQGINLDIIISKQTDNPVSATVKLDTGSTFCIFQRFYADLLGIEVEKGERESIRTAKGNFTAYGHDIVIKFSNLEWEAFVYFAQDESFPVSVIGRNGFLNKINIAIIDYEQLLYLKSYGG